MTPLEDSQGYDYEVIQTWEPYILNIRFDGIEYTPKEFIEFINKKMSKLENIIKKEGNSKVFVSNDLKCCIYRHDTLKHLCGYVECPESLRNIEYDDIYDKVDSICVHGGLTYSGNAYWDDNDKSYYVGFDCAHYGDIVPGTDSIINSEGIYRDMEYVFEECCNLAEQLQNYENSKYQRESTE